MIIQYKTIEPMKLYIRLSRFYRGVRGGAGVRGGRSPDKCSRVVPSVRVEKKYGAVPAEDMEMSERC